MPGKHIIGVVAELKRENEGEYVIPMCTIFGLEPEEKVWLVANQAKCGLTDQLTDKNRDEDGIEVATSAYRLMRILAKQFGFEVCDKPESACAGEGRTTLVWQMTKKISD